MPTPRGWSRICSHADYQNLLTPCPSAEGPGDAHRVEDQHRDELGQAVQGHVLEDAERRVQGTTAFPGERAWVCGVQAPPSPSQLVPLPQGRWPGTWQPQEPRWGEPPGPVPALSESSEHMPRAGSPLHRSAPAPTQGLGSSRTTSLPVSMGHEPCGPGAAGLQVLHEAPFSPRIARTKAVTCL